jgi:hypothetical protein
LNASVSPNYDRRVPSIRREPAAAPGDPRVPLFAPLLAALVLWLTSCAAGPDPAAAPGAEPDRTHAAARYELPIPPPWKPADRSKLPDVDLLVERDGGSSWLLVRSFSGDTLRLEDLVSARRQAILEANRVDDYRETRSYHPGERHIPVSLGRYQAGSLVLVTMAAVDGDFAVEMVGGTALGVGRERELLDLFSRLRFAAAGAR